VTDEPETVATETLVNGDRIALTFPARGDLVVLARLVSSAIATRVGFDIEELEDLRLAVGELCLLALAGSADARRDLQLEFSISQESLGISCRLGGGAASTTGHTRADEAEGEGDALSEQILSALVDEHGIEQADGSVTAWLRKRRKGPLA
jgi:serine/threonine-protein kinase RsbW